MKLSEKLWLGPDERASFLRATASRKLKDILPSNTQLNELSDLQFEALDSEQFKLLAEWYHYAILTVSEMPNIPARPSYHAKRFGISSLQASLALRRLVKMGLVKVKNKRLVRTGKPISVVTRGLDPAMRLFQSQMLDRARESLHSDPPEAREIGSITMAIDPDKLEHARETIKRFRRELCSVLETGNRRSVYTLAVQLFPLDRVGGRANG